MAYQYENNSPKASRGYAEPEREYKETVNYQPKSSGFADNLESQYYFDRPAVSQDRMQERMQETERPFNAAPQNNNYRQTNYQQSNYRQNNYQANNNYQQNNYQQNNYQANNNFSQNNYSQNNYGQQNNDFRGETPFTSNAAPAGNARQDAYNQNSYMDRFEEQRNRDLGVRYTKEPEDQGYAKPQGMVYTTDDRPSDTTMQFSSEVNDENPFEPFREKGESVDKKYTINTKGKILIAVYALVVVTVFALIILNTRLLKTMNATSKAKESEIAKLSEEVNNLYSELDYVSSDEVIEEKAAEKGMIKG